jgi:CheY-like chemotaxis protein
VEDDADVREALAAVLADEGYWVSTAIHGRAALDSLRAGPERPALILLDMMMPVMDGPTLCGQLSRDALLAAIPVVVLTAVGDAQQRARELGAVAALRKPVDLNVLLSLLDRLLSADPEG